MPRTPLAPAALALLVTACGGGAATPDAAPVDAASDRADAAVTPSSPACWRMPEGSRAPVFRGPSAPVEVIRDSLGVPHLYGATDEDVLFASGYMQAVDRLFQMELMRRSARGTLAAVVGREKLAQDQLVRRMHVARYGVESGERLRREAPEVHRLVDAWVAGVNRRVEEVRSGRVPRPAGFAATELDFLPSPWTLDDPFMVGRLILFQNANQLEFDLLSTVFAGLFPQAAEELPLTRPFRDAFVLPPDDRPARRMARRGGARRREAPARAAQPQADGVALAALTRLLRAVEPFARGASNNWAVAGRHTFNGRPLVAGDPHQPVRSPSVFWAHHMNSAARGGSLDVVGFAFAGAPAVQLGHNRRVAWTATTTYPDTMDLLRVPVDGDAATVGGRRVPVVRCAERVEVARGDAVELVTETVEGHGVLLPRDISPLPVTTGAERLMFRWVGFRPTAEASVFLGLDRAADVDAFDRAVQGSEIALFNFVGADARGIAYRAAALVPDRGPATARLRPFRVLDGADPSTLWGGAFVPVDRLPHSRGGARGFVASANNDPTGFTADGRIDDDAYYYGVWFDPGTRATRIEAELARMTARGGVTVADMQALQLDTHNLLADEVLPLLFAAFERVDADASLASYRGDARLAGLVAQLRAWDRHMDRDASAPVVFEAFQHFLARAVLADDLALLFDVILSREPVYVLKLSALTLQRRFPEADRYLQGGRDALCLRALAETRDWLAQRFGGVEASRYRWRDYHRLRIPAMYDNAGRLDAGTTQVAGSIGTVNVSQAPFFDGATPRMQHEARSGAAYRMVVSFDEDGTPRAVVNFPRGNSGDPASPYWANTHEDWLEGRYRALPFRRADVEADARERTAVMP